MKHRSNPQLRGAFRRASYDQTRQASTLALICTRSGLRISPQKRATRLSDPQAPSTPI